MAAQTGSADTGSTTHPAHQPEGHFAQACTVSTRLLTHTSAHTCTHAHTHAHARAHTHTHLHALLLQILDVRLPFDELALLNSYLPYLKRALNMDSLAVRVVDPTAYF